MKYKYSYYIIITSESIIKTIYFKSLIMLLYFSYQVERSKENIDLANRIPPSGVVMINGIPHAEVYKPPVPHNNKYWNKTLF